MLDSYEGEILYTYDALGQLTSETKNACPECSDCGTTVNVTYDNYGNILTKGNHTYGYDNVLWKDRLTSFDRQSITYDAQGNPTNYLGHNLTWEKGRQLKSFDNNTYTYNASGIRTSKTVDNVRHDYVVDGGRILKETWQDNVLVPIYNNEQEVVGIYYNCTPYYFFKNLQGDVIGISDVDGRAVVAYTYDAWGVCSVLHDNSGFGLSNINPYRYRSYYYDTEIGVYYLQSRYYDPVVGRFINADEPIYLGANGYNSSFNLFSYCENNSVNMVDYTGNIAANVLGAIIGGVIGAVGGTILGVWLADKLNITDIWARVAFIGAIGMLVGAAAAAIGYFVGPYVAKAWNFLSARLAGLIKNSFKSIGKISSTKMNNKINVGKHLWKNVLGKNTTSTNIKSLIYKAIRKGTWKYQSDGIIRIVLQQGKEYIVVTGNIVNGVFKIGDAWVWDHISNLWGY